MTDAVPDAPGVTEAAALLHEASRTRSPIAPVRTLLPAGDLAAAYAVQRLNTRRVIAEGGRVSGRKIGLTSAAVQQQLGVDQPDYGTLYAHMECAAGDTVAWSRLIQPKCEAEVAVVLQRDLAQPDLGLAELLRAIAYVLPALEIVDSRIADWDIRLTDTVADNASCGLYVLGTTPVSPLGLELDLVGMTLARNGDLVSHGVGAACLGHPMAAALWLARRMAALDTPLRAGEVVLTGALGPMVPVAPGDRFEARIAGLGRVGIAFDTA
ncbi:2-keto-4-pentenoate hydratase [Verticiella sediminum]|uniref:2-keto-4-pentenoate hydratase n=2 Tax=Verticiella sediminum TaxID=1247510 RepID=A0A556ANT1_9BURK|nr:2-keto-4-pentenoate hydratase [Verticiella sediminum]